MKKVRRILDGKIYAVHDTRPNELTNLVGARPGMVDYLVNSPADRTQIWLDHFEDVELIVQGDPPVDVP